ncbi:MAG: M28 family peptidase [Chloroflexi bacterium]|nr:M28 family peptidase [Chloroflexota bacterium]
MPVSVSKKNIKTYVEEICARSPRYAGTEGEIKSREYIVSEGEKLGVNVELEEFEYMHYLPLSSKLETLAPVEGALDNFPLHYAGSGVAEGEVIYVGYGTRQGFDFFSKQGIAIKGKIVLAETIGTSLAYSLAQQHGASGVVILTDAPDNLCRAGTATMNREAGQIPAVLVPVSVGRKLLTLMSSGQLKLRISLNGAFSKKTSSNIIMTIPGTTIPDEQIVLNAHYDSFNLGKHAADNAAGCAALLELLRIFSKRKSRRTIKAIMFGVEEIGPFWGSFAYVDRHADELPNIKAVVTFGTLGNPYDFTFELATTKEIRAFALNVVEQLGYEVKYGAEPMPVSDHVPFQVKGAIPVVWLMGNLGIFYHTAGDNPETLDYDKLKSLLDIEGQIAYELATRKHLPF